MGKIEIIKPNDNLIGKIADILLSSKQISENLIVFSNRRPGYFLNLALYEKKAAPFQSAKIFSIDDFISDCFEKLNPSLKYKNASDLDLAAILYGDFPGFCREITGIKDQDYALDFFMPWANKLILDFEELKINRLKGKDLRAFDFSMLEEYQERSGNHLAGFKEKYARFSDFYEQFYKKCSAEGIFTMAMKYDFVAENIDRLDISHYENVIFAGFFALPVSQKHIFRALFKSDKSHFIYIDSKLLKEQWPFENEIPFKEKTLNFEADFSKIKINIRKTGGIHEQIAELKSDLFGESRAELDKDSAVILPDADMIAPVLQNVLCRVEKFNISAGYPLKMTPIYSMLDALFLLLESNSADNSGRYSLREYFAFVMHPYVKNLSYEDRPSEETRKLFQDLLKNQARDKRLFSGLTLDELERMDYSSVSSLSYFHNKLIRPFENISNIKDFALKLDEIIKFISSESTASKHPYWGYFPGMVSEKLREITLSKISDISFNEKISYFSFMRNYLLTSAHPFKGSPVEGFQCLGFLEGRGLKFKNLFILDVNEGIIPAARKEDSIIPFIIREKLGISTYKTVSKMHAYYLENLIFSAENVWLYYIDDKNKESSPILEKIRWEMEKKNIDAKSKSSSVKINFLKKDPLPKEKTEEMKNLLKKKEFSYTSLNEYLKCQLSFYYAYVLKLKEYHKLSSEIERKDIGTLFHKILDSYFSDKINSDFSKKDCETEKEEIIKIAESEIEKVFPQKSSMENYMLKSQFMSRAADFIDFHFREHKNCVISSCEKTYKALIEVKNNKQARLMAKIDRIDERNGNICLVDYKISSKSEHSLPKFKLNEEDLEGDIKKWAGNLGSLQLPIYHYVYSSFSQKKDISASIITLGSKEINETRVFEKEEEKKKIELFHKALKLIIEDIFFSDSFLPTKDEKNCGDCPYKMLCGRQWVKPSDF